MLQNIVWEDLLMRKVKPPFVPTVVSDSFQNILGSVLQFLEKLVLY